VIPGRRTAVSMCAALALGAFPGAAHAADITSAELRDLAQRAESDPAALAELRQVDSVDGRPVDLGRALAGSDADVERRLEVLASGAPGSGGARTDARAAARDILAEGRFHARDTPRPFRGVLEWLGDRLQTVGNFFDRLAAYLPGGRSVLALLFAALVVLAAILVSTRLARRRGSAAVAEQRRRRARGAPGPDELEREAAEAERRGELELALRLRFRAGLLRLDRARTISFRDSMTSGEVARELRSADFDRLASTFDEVVYGRREAGLPDLDASREYWARVLQERAAL
jgi:hypothetical protein